MGISRYSSSPSVRRRQELFDDLQSRCRIDYYSPTITDLIDGGVTRARWTCSSRSCGHWSETFDLSKIGRGLLVRDLRRNYVCSSCGTRRPDLRLEWTE